MEEHLSWTEDFSPTTTPLGLCHWTELTLVRGVTVSRKYDSAGKPSQRNIFWLQPNPSEVMNGERLVCSSPAKHLAFCCIPVILMTSWLSSRETPRVWSLPDICITCLTTCVITNAAVINGMKHALLQSFRKALTPRKEEAVSVHKGLLVLWRHSVCSTRKGILRPQNGRKGAWVVPWNDRVCCLLLEGNYSLTQFMTHNVPNPLINASDSPPSTSWCCWPNKW